MSMADRIVVMNSGVIEQIGSPAEIYARPATEFVADFIGQMVFLDGVASSDGAVDVKGLKLALEAGRAPGHAGTPVRLGIRPEEVQVRGVTAGTPNSLDVEVTSGDYLGSFCRLTMDAGSYPGLTLVADLSSNDVRDLDVSTGRSLRVALPAGILRVFPAHAK